MSSIKEKPGDTVSDYCEKHNSSERYCDFGWTNYDGLCWKLIDTELPKNEAKAKCLVSIQILFKMAKFSCTYLLRLLNDILRKTH